jgi:hypothetical protein
MKDLVTARESSGNVKLIKVFSTDALVRALVENLRLDEEEQEGLLDDFLLVLPRIGRFIDRYRKFYQ